jgi:hypothetical protein
MILKIFQAKKRRGKGGIRAVLKNTTIRRMEELKTAAFPMSPFGYLTRKTLISNC